MHFGKNHILRIKNIITTNKRILESNGLYALYFCLVLISLIILQPHSREFTVNERTLTLFFLFCMILIKDRFLISKRIRMWKDFAEPKSNRIIQPLNSFLTFQKEWNWSEVIDYINFLIENFGFLCVFGRIGLNLNAIRIRKW